MVVEPFAFHTIAKLGSTKATIIQKQIPMGSKIGTVMMEENELNMRESWTKLSHERLIEVLDYDPSTGGFHWKVSTGYNVRAGDLAGSLSPTGYIRINIDCISYMAHNLAWFYVHKVWCMIDHKDKLRFNNRLANLRPTTPQLNAANRSYIGNNSGIKGVYKRGNRYEAGIKVNQRRIYLGLYSTLEEAADVYKQAAEKYFGDHACIR